MSNRTTSSSTGFVGLVVQGLVALLIVGMLSIGWWKIDVAEWFGRLRNSVVSQPVKAPAVRPLRRPRLASSGAPREVVVAKTKMPVPTKQHNVRVDRAVRPVVGIAPAAGSLSFPITPPATTSIDSHTASLVAPVRSNIEPPAPPMVAQTASPPVPALPVIAPTPSAPPVESVPPPAVPFDRIAQPTATDSAYPVTPPPAVNLGGFLAHGTITPDDVRAMALRSNKDIAVLGYVPPRSGTLVGEEASVFDPVFNVSFGGGVYNRQVATQVQALGPPIPELRTAFWQPLAGVNQVYLEKLFVSGGRAVVGIGQNYLNYTPAGSFVFVNPAYQSSLNLQLDQPLFRGRGPAATTALLQIARANQEQSWQAFVATVSVILRDADYAYWDVYAAFQDWEVRDLAVRQAAETLDRERGKLQLGVGSVPDVAQAEEQYEAFHIARADAENRLVNAQRTLRRIMGIPPSDERPLIPATPPTEAPIELDWNFAADEAQRRPEFAAQKAVVVAAEAEVARRRNGLLPNLSVRAIYAISGLNNNLDQAWSTVGSMKYEDWTAGLIYRQPLGRNSDRALAARAEMTLAMEMARMRQIEHEVLHQLDAAYQHVQNTQRLLEMHRRRREAAAVQLTARRELYLESRAELRDELTAEARYSSALYDEATARITYQRALTEWNYARGAFAEAGVAAAR